MNFLYMSWPCVKEIHIFVYMLIINELLQDQ